MTQTPRHRSPAPPRRRLPMAAMAGATAGAVLVSGVVLTARSSGAPSGCSSQVRPLDVAVSPDIAPVLADAVRRATPAGGCLPSVRAQEPGTVLDALIDGSAPAPDVWVPDSSLWLARAGRDAATVRSIATSPLVLAVSGATARALAGSGRPADLSALVAPGRPDVTLDLPDPHRSAGTTGAVLGLQAALAGRSDGRAVLVGLLQGATVHVGASERRGPVTVPDGVAVPTTAQAVRGSAVVALAAGGPGTTFDYPFAVLAPAPERQSRARALLETVLSGGVQTRLAATGLQPAAAAAPPVAPAAPAAVAAAEGMLEAVKQDARLLAVLDVSGSMDTTVPGAGRSTRLDLAKQAAGRGLSLYPDTSDVALWAFSTRLVGDSDHREVVPMVRLGRAADPASGRSRLGDALMGLQAVPNGDTGLYDTTLAAVRVQQQSWDPLRVNAVLLLTDGRNDDPAGLTLSQLLATLAAERDPRRPVPVIAIAYGPDSDVGALRQITDATSGSTYTSADPRQIQQVFLDAIGQRACRPHCAPVG